MEPNKPQPGTRHEVRDPDLPAIRGRSAGNLAEQHRRGAPLPADLTTALQQSEGSGLQ